ncbi:ABC transporter permease [Lysinibacillus xylanilyticus]|uniref:ABC transporter permease n=1 Tax=Lysinibacillus xylanilyticus TaxID=582475 RepID=UPI002B241981|nr:ABC transporter permease [Lysinibacillus xylanilyticus]MEB2302395.1 ABC transporter permease [Lysinibacillus xylanilyticus]
MANIFTIAWNTIKRNAKEKRVIIMMIVFPIVLILILGNALNASFEPSSMGTITVGYLNEDKGEVSGFFEDFLYSDEIKDIVDIQEISSVAAGKDQLDENKIDSFIYIGDGYSNAIAKRDQKAEIEVMSTDVAGYKATVVNSIVDSFINGANVTSALNQLTNESMSTSRYEGEEVVKDVLITASGEKPRAIDYYAITMFVMILMYGIAYVAEGLGEEVFGSMKDRFRSLPVKGYEMFLGKILGSIVLLLLQGLIIFGITKYAFNVDWGNSIGFVLLMLLVISFFATAFGVMLCTIARDVNQIRGLINTLVPLFTFISGGYLVIDLGLIKYISPNYLMQTALFNNIYGGDSHTTLTYILVLVGLIIVIGLFSIFQGRRKLS